MALAAARVAAITSIRPSALQRLVIAISPETQLLVYKTQIDSLKKFAAGVVALMRDGGDVDGGDLQDLAAATGVLVAEQVSKPCAATGCQCDELGADFPTTCYRLNREIWPNN